MTVALTGAVASPRQRIRRMPTTLPPTLATGSSRSTASRTVVAHRT